MLCSNTAVKNVINHSWNALCLTERKLFDFSKLFSYTAWATGNEVLCSIFMLIDIGSTNYKMGTNSFLNWMASIKHTTYDPLMVKKISLSTRSTPLCMHILKSWEFLGQNPCSLFSHRKNI